MMRNDEGAWFCDGCGRRRPDGGFQIKILGNPRPARKLKTDSWSFYCTERCLRDASMGLDAADDPVEQLTGKVSSLEKILARTRNEHTEAFEEVDAKYKLSLSGVGDAKGMLKEIFADELTREISDTERGKHLVRLLMNMQHVLEGSNRSSRW